MKSIQLIGEGFHESIFSDTNINNYYLYLFKKIAQENNFYVSTQKGNDTGIKIYFNQIPDKDVSLKNAYLIVREPSCVLPQIHKKKYYNKFKKVFTWNDNHINNKNIIKLNCIQTPIDNIYKNSGLKFCCLISSNKFSFHKDELYSERIKAIEFFNKNYPQDFDLFGFGWNSFFYPFKTSFLSLLKRDFSILKIFSYLYIILFKNNYSIYKGTVKDKQKTLSKYIFSICFENQKNTKGYITEKIWDCFFSGNIPIYLGANNIEKYIPSNCFIDMRKFNSYQELYIYLKKLTKKDIENFKENISSFLKSDIVKSYSPEQWSSIIIDNIQDNDSL